MFQQLYNSYITFNSRCDYWEYIMGLLCSYDGEAVSDVPLFRVDNGASLPAVWQIKLIATWLFFTLLSSCLVLTTCLFSLCFRSCLFVRNILIFHVFTSMFLSWEVIWSVLVILVVLLAIAGQTYTWNVSFLQTLKWSLLMKIWEKWCSLRYSEDNNVESILIFHFLHLFFSFHRAAEVVVPNAPMFGWRGV